MTFELRLDDCPDTGAMPSAARGVDLSIAETAILSFTFRTHSGVDTGDAIEVEISTDGGTSFSLLERIDGIIGAVSEERQHVISEYATPETTIRYRVARGYGGRYERFLIDNVAIGFTQSTAVDTGQTDPSSHEPQDPRVQVTHKVSTVEADAVHTSGITGQGVTIAFVDTGNLLVDEINRNANGQNRILANYDALEDTLGIWVQNDGSGHGTHVITTAISSYNTTPDGQTILSPDSYASGNTYHGVAPGADLVSVRAFDANGQGTYADVIRGLDWIVANKDHYGIRVVNLSFSAPPRSYYWDDPLNQAVMAAWRAGIVVVASAGNLGPDPMTIGVPGNVPYVITVGAMTDGSTPANNTDDTLASFSSAGPTVEAFVKPEVVAPGGHVMATMQNNMQIAQEHPEFYNGWYGNLFEMSGTSQAAAVVSGTVALMLEVEPWLTPDDVKCRLKASARPAVDERGKLGYSIFQQGAGLINAPDAIDSTVNGCANRGLDIDKDLAGAEHYAGPARQAEDGSYQILGPDGFVWSDALTEPAAVNVWVEWE